MNPQSQLPSRLIRWREIGRIEFLRLLRRKDALIPLFLVFVFGGGGLVFRTMGFDNPASATMLLNLGLTLAWASAHILAITSSTGQVGPERESRTLHPLLSRPLDRIDFLAGRWLACSISSAGVSLLLLLTAWVSLPRLEEYSSLLFLQSALLQCASLAATCAMGLSLSLYFSRPLALMITGSIFFGGGWIAGLVSRLDAAGPWLAEYLPDFGRLNLVTRYTDGIPALGFTTFAASLTYAAIWIFLFLTIASAKFRRMAL